MPLSAVVKPASNLRVAAKACSEDPLKQPQTSLYASTWTPTRLLAWTASCPRFHLTLTELLESTHSIQLLMKSNVGRQQPRPRTFRCKETRRGRRCSRKRRRCSYLEDSSCISSRASRSRGDNSSFSRANSSEGINHSTSLEPKSSLLQILSWKKRSKK